MKKVTLTLLLFFSVLSGTTQVEWGYSIGGSSSEKPLDICTDKYNNVYIVGIYREIVDFDPSQNSVYDTAASRDVYIQKMSPGMEHIWTKFIKGNSTNQSVSIICDDDHLYLTGGFPNTVDLDPGPGIQIAQSTFYPNIAFLKLTLDGDFVWGKSLPAVASLPFGIGLDKYSNIYMTGAYSSSMDFDPSENWYIAPSYPQASQFAKNGFISKYDADGNFMWVSPIIGANEEFGTSILTDQDGYSYVSGIFSGTIDFDPGQGTLLLSSGLTSKYIAKYDTNGNPLWAKLIQQSSSMNDDLALSTSEDAIYFLDYVGVSQGSKVLKLNPEGEILWNHQIEHVRGNSIVTDQEGNVFISGYFKENADFDPGPDTVEMSAAGTLGSNSTDIFVLKLDENGNYLSSTKFGDVLFDLEPFITNSPDNHIYLTGEFGGTVAIDNDFGSETLTSNGESDILVLKIHPNMDLTAEENCQDIDVYPNPATSNVFIHNHFSENVTISIYNAQGLIVYANSFANNSTAIPFDQFAQGMYIIHVKSDLCERKVKVLKN